MASKRSGSPLQQARLAARLAGASVLAGIVLAGVALPAVGAVGVSAKNTAQSFDEIPGDFKAPPLAQASYIYDAKGGLIAKVYERDRTLVSYDDIAPVMRQALVDIEDARFYQHGAIDLKGVLRALSRNAEAGTTAQGASTLTQQYVKNVFIEEAGNDKQAFLRATQQTMGRKIRELKYAIKLEGDLTKNQILTNYLNITFFGHQAYGIEAASERYFSKHARDLTLPEAAMLAGLVQSPYAYDPIEHPVTAKQRRDIVLQRMADLKHITQAQADAAKKSPLGLRTTEPRNGCITAQRGEGFFCDYVRHVIKTDPAFGKTAKARAKLWTTGGLRIYTTLDPKVQQAVQASIDRHVYRSDKVATAVSVVQPGTGQILAMGQSRPYGLSLADHQTLLNLNVDHSMGGSTYGFQTGSTFKPFTAAAALEKGIPPSQTFRTGSQIDLSNQNWPTCHGSTNTGDYHPGNESKKEAGTWNMPTALAKSINTYFLLLEKQTGLCDVATMAGKLGVHTGSGQALHQYAQLTLGGETIAPLTMASAYAAFANRGTYCTPVAISSVTSATGKRMPVPQTSCDQVMSQQTADTVTTMLKGVVQDGTGRQAGLSDRDSAGKTGTTNDRKAAWFVGYVPQMAAAVWVGGPTTDVPMVDITIGGVWHQKVYGADTPGPIWRDAMAGALQGVAPEPFHTVNLPKPPAKSGGQGGGKGGKNQPAPMPTPSTPGGTLVGGATLPPGWDGGKAGGSGGWTGGVSIPGMG